MAYHVINTNQSNSNNNNNNGNGGPTITSVNPQQAAQPAIPETLIDYQELAKKNKIHKVEFRKDITNRLLTTLTTTNHPNAMLVGEAGTGKTAIVEDLAVRLFEKEPITTAILGDETKIYELPLTNLVAGSSMLGAMESKIKDVVQFISDPKEHAILYIDEIHQLMTNNELKKVAEILKPALSRGDLHVIGSTTTQELKFWNQNPALSRRFSNVIVDELTNEQTKVVLEKSLPRLQANKTQVDVDPTLFNDVVKYGNQYAKTLSTHRPDSALTILDQALSIARLENVTLQQTMQIKSQPKITKKTLKKAGKQLLNNNYADWTQTTIKSLIADLKANIIGQPRAKKSVVNAVQSMVLNLVPQTKPHSFLFAGPTGTGKTEIAKQLAKVLFGSEDNFTYLNMTEYANRGSITSLIGSSRGFVGSDSAQPLPLDGLKSQPAQIIVLDEFEKADLQVKQLFMQALDEGTLRYADGSTVDFSHAIVIGTTNAGSQAFNKTSVGFTPSASVSNADMFKALMQSFPPELLNRFERIVSFDPIDKEQYKQILVIKYQKLIKLIQEQRPEINIVPKEATIEDAFIKDIADKSYDKLKNARPAERNVQRFIEAAVLKNQPNVDVDMNQFIDEHNQELAEKKAQAKDAKNNQQKASNETAESNENRS